MKKQKLIIINHFFLIEVTTLFVAERVAVPGFFPITVVTDV